MSLATWCRAVDKCMPASSRWALFGPEQELLMQSKAFPSDRHDFMRVIGELIPYLELASGDILLVKGPPILPHAGDAALVMTFPKSLSGQDLFFVERISLDPFPENIQDPVLIPPLYLSRDFHDEGDILGDLSELIDSPSLELIRKTFHHLLWVQLKVLDLLSSHSLKKLRSSDLRSFLSQHRVFLQPYFKEIADQTHLLDRSWSEGKSLSLKIEKKKSKMIFDFSGCDFPTEWNFEPTLLNSLVASVLHHHLYPEVYSTCAEEDFFSLVLPRPKVSTPKSPTAEPTPGWLSLMVPHLLCDFISESLSSFMGESSWAPSASGPLFFRLEFESGSAFRHLLLGGGGASHLTVGDLNHNPWVPGLESLSLNHSLKDLPLKPLNFGRWKNSGGEGLLPGGDGVEWSFETEEPCQIQLYTFQGLWPAQGKNGGHHGQKAQVLWTSKSETQDLLGKKIQVKKRLSEPGNLILRTGGGAGLGS